MIATIAITESLVLLALALLHLRWAFGGRTPSLAVLPEVEGRPAFVPGLGATLAVAAALFAAALLVATAGGVLPTSFRPVPAGLARLGCFALAAVFALRAIGDFRLVGFFKRLRGTRFARLDTLVYSPLCVLLAAGAFAVARAVPA